MTDTTNDPPAYESIDLPPSYEYAISQGKCYKCSQIGPESGGYMIPCTHGNRDSNHDYAVPTQPEYLEILPSLHYDNGVNIRPSGYSYPQSNTRQTQQPYTVQQPTQRTEEGSCIKKRKWWLLAGVALGIFIPILIIVIEFRATTRHNKDEYNWPKDLESDSETPVSVVTPGTKVTHLPPSGVSCIKTGCYNGGSCIYGSCQCQPEYYGDYCETMSTAYACDIKTVGTVAAASPSMSINRGYETHSCITCPTQGCLSQVHMIAMYEPENSYRGFREDPVDVKSVPVTIKSTRSHTITLVLSTYEAAHWVIHLPQGVTLKQVLLIGYYLRFSSVTVYNHLSATVDSHSTRSISDFMDHKGTGPPARNSWGYGCFSCRGVEFIDEHYSREYGCFTSFTGRYEAKSWTLDLDVCPSR